ncbi:hypothetical protein EPO34_02400 [Patescibacteria group bacterium]|nr:MAG: hypothetical protein EPO34_02400 [Patescibacteria group bacterium]
MDERVKRGLQIAAFVGSVLLIGTGLYFAFFRGQAGPSRPPAAVPAAPAAPGSLPSAGLGAPAPAPRPTTAAPRLRASAIANGGATSTNEVAATPAKAIVAAGSGISYYDPADGKFYGVDADGNVRALSEQAFPQASDVEWNKGADKAVIEFPDGSNVVYDFATQTQVTLPAHWEDFHFSPGSDEILAKSMGLDPNNRFLVVSNGDGSNVKSIQALGNNAHKVTVAPSPNDQVVAFADTADPLPGGIGRKLIVPIGKNQEHFKGLAVEGFGFSPNWAPDGARLLYSVSGDFSSYLPQLWIVDATAATMGEHRQALPINTWADKCAFSGNNSLLCAVPRALPANAGLQRGLADAVADDLFRVDLATGAASRVAVPATNTRMTGLTVTADGSAVFFKNEFTGTLESIRLK